MNVILTQTWNVQFDRGAKRWSTPVAVATGIKNDIRQKEVLVNWDLVESARTLDLEANPVFVGKTSIHFSSGGMIQVIESLGEIQAKLEAGVNARP